MKGKLTPEDLRLWKSQLKDVTPLLKTTQKQEVLPSPQKKQPLKRRPLFKKEAKEVPVLSLPPPSSLGRKELRQMKVDGRLDLHGMSLEEGYQVLERFLIQARTRKSKIVLIITGKGNIDSKNTFRHQLPRWLLETSLRSLVSFFHHPAKPRDGGSGAFYVGIKRK